MKNTEQVRKTGAKRYAGGICVFAVFYLLLLATILLMIVLNSPSDWIGFLKTHVSSILSLIICTFFLCVIIYYYYYFEKREFLLEAKNLALVFTLLIVSAACCYAFGKYVNIYARPFALLALVCLFLFNRRQAILFNFVFSLLMFVIDTYTNNFAGADSQNGVYFSLMLSFVCGTFSIFAAGGIKTRGGLLAAGAVISIPTFAIILLLELPVFGEIGTVKFITSAAFGVLGCMCSAVLTLAFLPVFERVFNCLTVFRLRELTRTDASLLMRLKKEAPGTFNHSLIVAQLAETCALALGENAELARAVAYYHDVGKLKQPDCFTENQTGYNIHNELTPELSADIIRSHAQDGYDLLSANHMPQLFADVAREHHGTLPIKFFYAKAMKLSGGDANVKDYSYLGPTPHSKIAAIVMIADASEAAVRAMRDRTPESVEKIVRSIIEERMDLDQFVECDITMRELTVIKQTLVAALSGIHHQRVAYPAIRFNKSGGVNKE